MSAFWSQLLPRPGSGRTDIVIADSSLSLFQEILDRQMTLSEYLKPDSWLPREKLAANPALEDFASRAAQRRFTSLASVTAVYRIGRLAGPDQMQDFFLFRAGLQYPRNEIG